MGQTQFFLRDEEITIDPKLVFVLLPFEYTIVFEKIIKPILKDEFNLDCKKADDLFTTGTIMQDIANSIRKSTLIIADLTGKNPNVYYELGLAYAFEKSVILITQSGKDVPSDLRAHKYYEYDLSSSDGIETFQNRLREIIKTYIVESLIVEKSQQTVDVHCRKGNEVLIDSSFLLQKEGAFSIWAYVSEEHDKISSPEVSSMYIVAHSMNEGRQIKIEIENPEDEISEDKKTVKIYPNVFAIRKTPGNKENPNGYWRFWCNCTSNASKTINTPKEFTLTKGWHLFTVCWSKQDEYIKFYIDTEIVGTIGFQSWPEEVAKHLFIGTWPTRNKKHYFNSKIGKWIIYKNAITYEKLVKYYKDNQEKFAPE